MGAILWSCFWVLVGAFYLLFVPPFRGWVQVIWVVATVLWSFLLGAQVERRMYHNRRRSEDRHA